MKIGKMKLIPIFAVIFMLAAAFWGCGKSKEQDATVVRVASLKGPTSIGLVKLMEDNEAGLTKSNYEFNMYTSADEIVPLIAKGEIDVAAVPANLASVLYQKTNGGISVININTLGVLYVVENGTQINGVADLKGKTIYMTGKGTVPEYAVRYILAQNGLSEADVTLEFKSEPTEVASILAQDAYAVGVLPQPFVTVACTQNEKARIAVDLTKEWSDMLTGVTIVRNEFLKEHEGLVKTLLEDYKASTDYVNANVEEAAALVEKYDIVKAAVAKKAIPYCNVTSIAGKEMKEKLSKYLEALYSQEPAAVGGKLPDETFYYGQ